jgi:CO/xanthine dehydrogenase Mo-binding subunit
MTTVFDEPEIRVDGLDKVTGVARYTADREVPGALVVRYRYAGLTHGTVRRIDTRRAEQIDGVRAILTGRDTQGLRAGRRLQDWPLLAWDRVRFAGDRIAAVAAETESAADAAVAALEVEYDELQPLLDPARSLDADAPVLHPDASTYRFLGGERHPRSHPNIQGEVLVRKGPQTDEELERLFAPPAIVIDEVYRTGRQHQGYLEAHASAVRFSPAGRAEVITTNKAPFSLRRQLSAALDMPLELIEVDSAVIGGDFGGKGLSIDEYVLLLLARRTGRPARLAVGYDEELRAYGPRHGGHLRLRTAVDADGRIVAHDADILLDGGAYAAAKPVPELITPGALHSMAPYDIPALRIRVRVVYTNTVPGGHMRCPGELQAAFASESHVDELAAATGLDPIEFRRRNVLSEGSSSAVGELIRRPMAGPVLEALAAQAPVGGSPSRGFGVALVARRMEGGQQSVGLRPIDDRRIQVLTGLPDQGAGAHTMMIRVAARCLSIPADRFTVRQLTTAAATADLGVGASRVTYIASRAVEDAASRLREALEVLAETIAGGGPVHLRNGRFERAGDGPSVELDDVLLRAATAGMAVVGTYDSTADGGSEGVDFTFAGMAVEAGVDTGTGRITIERATFAGDTGTVINPIAHRGQIEGGFAQGLGAALMEELLFEGGAITNQTLADYNLPASTDVPRLDIIGLAESPGGGAFGAKMVGELSPSTVSPAIGNAIAQVTGVRLRQIPMTPERVLAALAGRQIEP